MSSASDKHLMCEFWSWYSTAWQQGQTRAKGSNKVYITWQITYNTLVRSPIESWWIWRLAIHVCWTEPNLGAYRYDCSNNNSLLHYTNLRSCSFRIACWIWLSDCILNFNQNQREWVCSCYAPCTELSIACDCSITWYAWLTSMSGLFNSTLLW